MEPGYIAFFDSGIGGLTADAPERMRAATRGGKFSLLRRQRERAVW